MSFVRSTLFKRDITKTGKLCLARHAGYAPAVDHHAMAVDVAGQFRYQEQDHVGDLFRFGDAAQGDAFLGLLEELGVGPVFLDHRGPDPAGGYGIVISVNQVGKPDTEIIK